MDSAPPRTVICFGEALWDILPRGIFLGGAPLNVAYHLSRHGITAVPVSAVGRDFLGDEALRRIAGWQLDSRFVARLGQRPTGTVRATLSSTGVATYSIARRVAWDRIAVSPALTRLPSPAALVYGTLAIRERSNRNALSRLFTAWPNSLRVVDLNLRPPFDGTTAMNFALRQCQLLKLNHEELGRLVGRGIRSPANLKRAAFQLARKLSLPRICVTAGAMGAGLYWDGAWHWEAGRPVVVRDTVGAGDAFFGALLAAILVGDTPPATALARACRLGEFVASRDGATPSYIVGKSGQIQ